MAYALPIVRGLEGLIEYLTAKAIGAAFGRRRVINRQSIPSGFLVGYRKLDIVGDTKEPVFISEAERRKHLYVLGATGCGKTNLLLQLIEEEISHQRTCVVIDLRGDLIDRVLLRVAASEIGVVDRVRLIDLREDEFVTPFNPLVGQGDVYSRALHVLAVIRLNADSFGIQLDETLRNCLIALAESNQTLLDIERLLADKDFRAQIIGSCSDSQVHSFFGRYDEFSSEKQLAWSLPVLKKVTPLLTVPQLRRMLGSGEGFDWQKVLDAPGQIILVALAAHRFHGAAQLIGGLLVSSIQNSVMARASVSESKRNSVTLFIDEFETMASPSFAAIIAEGRRFGLSLVLSHQNLSQLDPGLCQVIRNNVAIQLFFQTGSSDATDLAHDVVSSESKESIRQALISQRVGQAFLVRRGQPSVQVETLHAPDPDIDLAKVKKLTLECLKAHCRTRLEVDRKLSRSRTERPVTNPIPREEVRHDKLPQPRQGQ